MIYVVTHKKVDLNLPEGYKIISVGKYDGTEDGHLCDQTGNSISSKNYCYCELTALYWLWANQKVEGDVFGLCHYRRFFYRKNKLIDEKFIDKTLQKYDAIVPRKFYMRTNNRQFYLSCGYEKDLDTLREVVAEIYPEYLADYDAFFKSKSEYFFNMTVCKKQLFYDYCKWLFDILFEVEKRTDISGYDTYKARIFGFMSERLLNIYLIHNKLKVKQVEVRMPGEKRSARMASRFKNAIKRILYH